MVGQDVGAINYEAGIIERDVNLKIANYLKQYLSEYAGIDVLMTHSGFLSGTYELIDRAIWARNNKADLIISLHCNSSTSGKITGTEAYVTANTSLPKYNQECSKLASLILNNISKLGIKNRGVKTRLSGDVEEVYSDGTRGDYYGIIRYAMKGVKEGPGANIQNGEGISTVLVEHCYIQGEDAQYLDSDEDIKKLAKADCDAIVEYYSLRLKSECVSGINLNKTNLNLSQNAKEALVAEVTPETATNKNVKWTSSNEKIVTVNENGEITTIEQGNAIITATTEDGEYKATCNITVTGLEVLQNELYLLQEDTYKVEYEPKDVSVDFKVEDNAIAQIDENGIITALKKGTTKVIISSKKTSSLKQEILINVSGLAESQKIIINNLKNENCKLSKINEKTTNVEFVKNIETSSDLEVKINNNEKEYIATNTIVDIIEKTSGKILKRYYCLIYGDINQDGKITAADYVLIKNHIMETSSIKNSLLDVADVSRDTKLTTKDYVLIKNHIMQGTELPNE